MKPSFQMYQQMKKSTNGKINPMKCSIIKECEYCNTLFTPSHHSQKFCSPRCYREHRRDYKAKWKRDNENTDEKWYRNKPTKNQMGTGLLFENANDDKKKEERAIKNELRRLGL